MDFIGQFVAGLVQQCLMCRSGFCREEDIGKSIGPLDRIRRKEGQASFGNGRETICGE